ncbi:hypothetical protein ABZW32_24650 [Streptomyces sp. NPDC004667]|uniref:hypothetical protein n=1 Tax=Streptomyces sp. NPDC004667 TaxID=3154285 RepID=UPI0033B58AE4
MRKALIISALAATAAMAIGSPTAAFAADATPTAVASPQASQSPSDKENSVTLDKSTARPGDTVKTTLHGPALTDVKVTGEVLTNTSVFQNIYGQGTVAANAKPGQHKVTMTGKDANGKEVSVSTTLTVSDGTPADTGTLTMTPGEGAAGSKVGLSLKIGKGTPPKGVTVNSKAFGGSVNLTQGKDGVWSGTAKVAEVKNGDYDVAAVSNIPGTKAFATGKFKVNSKTPVTPPTPIPSESPVPSEGHVIPKGSVNTGMSPAGSSTPTAEIVAGGAAAAAAAGALALALRKRTRGNNG